MSNEYIKHREDVKNGIIDLNIINSMPSERYNKEYFNFKPLSLRIDTLDKATVFSISAFVILTTLSIFFWGTQGYIYYLIYVSVVNTLYGLYITYCSRYSKNMSMVLSNALHNKEIRVKNNRMIPNNEGEVKAYMRHFADISGRLYYKAVYNKYVTLLSSAPVATTIIFLIVATLAIKFGSVAVTGLSVYYIALRIVNEFVFLRYFRESIGYIQQFSDNYKASVQYLNNKISKSIE